MAQSMDTNTITQRTKSASQSNDECGQCGTVVGGRDKGILCEICDRWFHTIKVPESVRGHIQSIEKGIEGKIVRFRSGRVRDRVRDN